MIVRMTPSEKIQQTIDAFAVEWVASHKAGTVPADATFLAACVTAIVDDAVRDAILLTAKALQP